MLHKSVSICHQFSSAMDNVMYRVRSPPKTLTICIHDSLLIAQAIWGLFKNTLLFMYCGVHNTEGFLLWGIHLFTCSSLLSSVHLPQGLSDRKQRDQDSFTRQAALKHTVGQPSLQCEVQHVPTLEKTHCLMWYNQQGQALYRVPCNIFYHGLNAATGNICAPLAPHSQNVVNELMTITISRWPCRTTMPLCRPTSTLFYQYS